MEGNIKSGYTDSFFIFLKGVCPWTDLNVSDLSDHHAGWLLTEDASRAIQTTTSRPQFSSIKGTHHLVMSNLWECKKEMGQISPCASHMKVAGSKSCGYRIQWCIEWVNRLD